MSTKKLLKKVVKSAPAVTTTTKETSASKPASEARAKVFDVGAVKAARWFYNAKVDRAVAQKVLATYGVGIAKASLSAVYSPSQTRYDGAEFTEKQERELRAKCREFKADAPAAAAVDGKKAVMKKPAKFTKKS